MGLISNILKMDFANKDGKVEVEVEVETYDSDNEEHSHMCVVPDCDNAVWVEHEHECDKCLIRFG